MNFDEIILEKKSELKTRVKQKCRKMNSEREKEKLVNCKKKKIDSFFVKVTAL